MGFVDYEVDGHVAVITINRPKALNALNEDVLKDIEAAFDAVDLSEIRAIILTGAGEKSFVAGADIAAMSVMTKEQGEHFGKFGNDIFRKIETFPVPVIAAVNGFALGGGNELAMSCDIRICSDNALFGQPEVGLGITPGFGGTQRLARLIGPGKAKEMVFASRNIKADEAYRVGLVNAVYTQEELMPAAKNLAGEGLADGESIVITRDVEADKQDDVVYVLEFTTEDGNTQSFDTLHYEVAPISLKSVDAAAGATAIAFEAPQK